MSEDQKFPRRFGKYKLLSQLAEGGMGAVYLAAAGSRGMEKVCALKVVLPSLATPEYCSRFMDEAKVMVRLSHPKVVQAIQDQAARFIHMSGTDFYYQPEIELAERLNGIAPMSGGTRVFLTNSGAESVEAAFKLARYYTRRPRTLA